jgi:hypothetical protein
MKTKFHTFLKLKNKIMGKAIFKKAGFLLLMAVGFSEAVNAQQTKTQKNSVTKLNVYQLVLPDLIL